MKYLENGKKAVDLKIAYVGGLVITAAFLALFLAKANQAKAGLKK